LGSKPKQGRKAGRGDQPMSVGRELLMVNQFSTPVTHRGRMANLSGGGKKRAARSPRKKGDLLAIWLDLLKQIDNPPKRRAARLRRAQRPRRPIPIQRLRLEGYGSQVDAGGRGPGHRRATP